MPRRLRWLLVLFPLWAAAQNGSPVEGQLLNSVTQAPIAGARVLVRSTRTQLTYETYTGPDGRFQIPLVTPGDYLIVFQAQDYLPLPLTDPATQVFHVADMAAPVHFQEELTPYGVVSGRVFDGNGRPAVGVRMEMLKARGGGLTATFTDGDGHFSVGTLAPGAYVLLARPMLPGSGGDEKHPTVLAPPKAREGERLTWPATYYPASTERSGAQTIVIHPGSNLTAYDMRLHAAPLVRVRGTVLDDQGKAAGGADVTLHSSEPLTEPEARAQSTADGSFELADVCPGDWHILAEVKRGTVTWRGSAFVSVARRDVEDVPVRVAPPFAIDGFVERGDALSMAGDRPPMTVQLAPVDGASARRVTAEERRDGSLRFENVYAGSYRILALGTIVGYYLDSVSLGFGDVTGQIVDLAPGAGPVRVVYRSGAGRTVGSVENGWGSSVVLVPQEDWLVGPPFVRTVAAGMDGHFDIGSLRPGDYYIWAFDRVDPAALTDPDFLRNLVPPAATVRVAQGAVVVAPNLKVTPWPE